MEEQEIITASAADTQEAAGRFVKELLEETAGRDGARLICLRGDLGSGKTTFAQGAARELGVDMTVNSPTFLIMKKYPLKGQYKGRTLYHLDCYRIHTPGEAIELGWEEILREKGSVIFVEWPERIERILPKERIEVYFEALMGSARRISFKVF